MKVKDLVSVVLPDGSHAVGYVDEVNGTLISVIGVRVDHPSPWLPPKYPPLSYRWELPIESCFLLLMPQAEPESESGEQDEQNQEIEVQPTTPIIESNSIEQVRHMEDNHVFRAIDEMLGVEAPAKKKKRRAEP